MQLITQNRSWQPCTPLFTLFPYKFIAFVLVMGFAVINISASVFAQYTTLPSNPFASFADVFPGQPRHNLEAHGFSCVRSYPSTTQHEYCFLYPAAGTFSLIIAGVTQSEISSIGFTMRDSILRGGDLILLWGSPHVDRRTHTLHFFSDNLSITAYPVEPTWQFPLFLPVQRVLITYLSI